MRSFRHRDVNYFVQGYIVRKLPSQISNPGNLSNCNVCGGLNPEALSFKDRGLKNLMLKSDVTSEITSDHVPLFLP